MTKAVKGARILTPAERHELREGLAAAGLAPRRWYACGHDPRDRICGWSHGRPFTRCGVCQRESMRRYRSRKVETLVSVSPTTPEPHPISKLPGDKGAEGTRAKRALALVGGGMLGIGEAEGC